ncbi:carboxyl-terminal processing protease CtpZ [Synechococcus lacustris]|uniref:carboxyl-terminal processing protease CtpZ n=1 Tax=Synechococcus lacustris TaxID=2116544 RepID=UPI0036F40666
MTLLTLVRGVLCLLLSFSCWSFAAQPSQALSDEQALVVDVWRLVNEAYVDPSFTGVPWRKLRQKALEKSIQTPSDAYSAIDAMLAPLQDPYTRLLRPEAYSQLEAATKGSVSGVGLQLGLQPESGQVVVIAPVEDSPAAEAGLSDGTLLVTINGQATGELGLEGSAALLRGSPGSRVHLEVISPKGENRSLDLERRPVDLRPVRSRRLRAGEHTFGYLRISQFSETVPEAVAEALNDLQAKSIEGLVLDLRNNSGGLVSAGLAVADDLLPGQVIVETQDRNGISERRQANPQTIYSGPMVTLINGGTASASEILGGALQDNQRSELLGATSFGKGEIQTMLALGDGSGLAVTVARYLTPNGNPIQGVGLMPDQLLSAPEPQGSSLGSDEDQWLQAASSQLLLQLSQ